MTAIVISQPMFLPWIGLWEQVRLADTFLHYDDTQMPQGRSFISRVQIKTHTGTQWLTVPIVRGSHLIKDVMVDDSQHWRKKHLKAWQHNYAKAPFADEMLVLAEAIYSARTAYLSEFNINALEHIAQYFGIAPHFNRTSYYQIKSSSSEKVIELVKSAHGTVYITGHGARHYLDHLRFEANNIQVQYMDYQRTPYPQMHGAFDPHVSILDLIANVGQQGIGWIHSSTKNWRDFLYE